jgi:hypothetical protein
MVQHVFSAAQFTVCPLLAYGVSNQVIEGKESIHVGTAGSRPTEQQRGPHP